MKKTMLYTAAICLLTCGCQTNAGTGALTGGLLGAGTGALIDGGRGAAIGGAAGIVAGALIGNAINESSKRNLERDNPGTLNRVHKGHRLSVEDVIALSEAGVSDSTIIDLIDQSGSHYNLNSAKIIRLKRAGVSERVINHMIRS